MKMLMDNWFIVVAIVALLAAAFVAARYFFSLPTSKQKEKVKQWLLWAVVQAEAKLGGKTGQLKLAMVYDMFLARFPTLSRFISFDTFSNLVDDALERMETLLKTNTVIKRMVDSQLVTK